MIRLEMGEPQHVEWEAHLEQAAQVLNTGGLVAFPTETVYGLGGDAFDVRAVEQIFTVKQRPRNKPLSVLVPSIALARSLVREWPPEAERLAQAFWPGPLTLVLPRSARVPDIVTAGGDTVGVRIPAHPVALALLERSGLALATPSANPSGSAPPTTGRAVLEGLGDAPEIAVLLDAGETTVKVASTVVGLAEGSLLIYREGSLSPDRIEHVLSELRQK